MEDEIKVVCKSLRKLGTNLQEFFIYDWEKLLLFHAKRLTVFWRLVYVNDSV